MPFTEDPETGVPLQTGTPTGVGGAALKLQAEIFNGHLKATADAHPMSAITGLADALDALAGGETSGPGNQFVATPADGSTGAVVLRSMVAADVPFLATSKITGLDAALAAKAPLASPTFTGTPAAPTATAGTNTTQVATTAYVRSEVAALVGSAPGTLDTIGEIAAAIAADESTAAALAATVGGKMAKASNLSDVASVPTARTNLGLVAVASSGSAADLSTGTLNAARLPTGINANKVADGSVSNADFQYIAGLTGSVQDQLDALAGGGGSPTPTPTLYEVIAAGNNAGGQAVILGNLTGGDFTINFLNTGNAVVQYVLTVGTYRVGSESSYSEGTSGTFTTTDGKTVTVVGGLVTSIV